MYLVRVNGQGREVRKFAEAHNAWTSIPPLLEELYRARSCISFVFFINTYFNSYYAGFHSCLDRWIDSGQCTEDINQYYYFHFTYFFNLSTCHHQLVRRIRYVHSLSQLQISPCDLRQLMFSSLQGIHLPGRLDQHYRLVVCHLTFLEGPC